MNWDQVKNVHIATFKRGTTTFFAYFQEDGTILGIARLINIDQMPLSINRSIQPFLKNYNITRGLEFISNEADMSYYFVQLENSAKRIIVKVYADGENEIIKKQKKTNL